MLIESEMLNYQDFYLNIKHSSRDNAMWMAIRDLRLSLHGSLLTVVCGETGLAKASLITSVAEELYVGRLQLLNCDNYQVLQQQEVIKIISTHRKKCGVLIVKVAEDLLLDEQQAFMQNVKRELSDNSGCKILVFCDTKKADNMTYRFTKIIKIPPLRDRMLDILPLSHKIIPTAIELDIRVMSLLLRYKWPLNVKELLSVLTYAYNMLPAGQKVITVEQLKIGITDMTVAKTNLYEHQDAIEKELIIEAMQLTNNNITQAANRLGIKRQALQYKLKKYGIN